MRKVYVIRDSAGWMSDFVFSSYRKANKYLNFWSEKYADAFDLPLSIIAFDVF